MGNRNFSQVATDASISTGIYGYPRALAADTAIQTVLAALADAPGIEEVVFCCFSAEDLATYQESLG